MRDSDLPAEMVVTEFRVRQEHQGLMPADLMQKSGDTLIMKLSRMNFPETPDTFNAGTTIKVELNVDRVFNNEYKLNHQSTHYDNQ